MEFFKDWTSVQIALAAVASIGIASMVYNYFSKTQPRRQQRNTGTRKFTTEELRQFDGEKKPEVYIALKGIVYDVSSSQFYRKPSGYAVFAGHDASINLAKMAHDTDILNSYNKMKDSLTGQEKRTLDDWVNRFEMKYPVLGTLAQ